MDLVYVETHCPYEEAKSRLKSRNIGPISFNCLEQYSLDQLDGACLNISRDYRWLGNLEVDQTSGLGNKCQK